MVGNRSYRGKWGIKMCLQNLDTQKLLSSQLCIRTPDLICPCPALSWTPHFQEEKRSSISWKLCSEHSASSLRLGRSSSGAVTKPAAGLRQGNMAAEGLLYLICYCHAWQVREKNTKNQYGCLALPVVRLCLVLFLNFPALIIQSAIFQAWCLFKVFGKGQPTIQLFLKRKQLTKLKKKNSSIFFELL